MLLPVLFMIFGGFATYQVGTGTLYSQCYEDGKLLADKCSHEDIQNLVKKDDHE